MSIMLSVLVRKIKCAWLLLAVIAATSSVVAYADSYISGNDVPNPVAYLPPPPDSTMIMRNGDYARWIWGKTIRNTARGEMASGDSKYGTARTSVIFGEILGIEITASTTPAIYQFMMRAGETGAAGVSKMKHAYFRKRPFVLMVEQTWGAHDSYSELAPNSSYPSSHTGNGWGAALALAEMAPHLQDSILWRGYQYGVSRVIVGAHWMSDVNAAFLCATAAISRARLTPEYQADLEAAKQEYMQIKGISEEERNPNIYPSALTILDAPAMDDSYLYYGEVGTYWKAKEERNTVRGAQAVVDANLSDDAILAGFAPCFDITVSPDSTPSIVSLMKNLKLMLGLHAASMKDIWFRSRPYVQLGDTTMVPGEEQEYYDESSYPSGHALIGWGLALTLAEVMPECQNAILKRGYDFGWSRVIAGFHYPGDVQAGWIMASSLMTKMHNDAYFNSMLDAAKQEYAEIKTQQDSAATMMAAQQLSFLPLPPDSLAVGFAGDFYHWIWGKQQRDTELGELAAQDSGCDINQMCDIFSNVLEIDISATPAIYSFISHAAEAAEDRAGEISEDSPRKRPYVLMNEQPWGVNSSQQSESESSSYPSIHAAKTWTVALALAQLAPNKQDTILKRAFQCAGSEVITGESWQTDIDAGLVVAGEVICQLLASRDYDNLFNAALNEYMQVTGLTDENLTASYISMIDLLGTPLDKDNVLYAADAEAYWHTKSLRPTERGALAEADAALTEAYLIDMFNACTPAIEISEENTPSIVYFFRTLQLILNSRATSLKGSTSRRVRPYRMLQKTTQFTQEERQLYSESSYPSRHALIGWGLAMALAEVMPDYRQAILKRAFDYGESRIIKGMCYSSDITAARIMAMCDIIKLHNDTVFSVPLDSAKAEYRQKRLGDVNGDGQVTSFDITVLYSYLLTGDDSSIVFGDQDGDGIITTSDITTVYSILLGSTP